MLRHDTAIAVKKFREIMRTITKLSILTGQSLKSSLCTLTCYTGFLWKLKKNTYIYICQTAHTPRHFTLHISSSKGRSESFYRTTIHSIIDSTDDKLVEKLRSPRTSRFFKNLMSIHGHCY